MKTLKKLIEGTLPLEAINTAASREKSLRHGHPSTLHLWWARRPLASARAVIFAQMVDDPSAYVDVLREDPKLRRKAETALKVRLRLWEQAGALAEKAKGSGLPVSKPSPAPTLDDMLADEERQRLFRIIEDLVLWENTTDETVLAKAREEIWESWRRTCAANADHRQAKEVFDRSKLPAFHDPFAGGGALPMEAQRLGLESYASDLNPVAVMINKAMIEIPPRFARRPPVNPGFRRDKELVARTWEGAQGLAEDVRYYGRWMRDEAERRIGRLYPKVEVTADMVKDRPDLKGLKGQKLTVIAWLWVRTVRSPNPAYRKVEVPLASSFMLSTKSGKEAYVQPVVEHGGYRFTVRMGRPKDVEAAKSGTKLARANFACLMSNAPISGDYLKEEGKAGRMGARLLAIVAEGDRGRVYLAPTPEHEAAALAAKPTWRPEGEIAARMTGGNCTPYGLESWGDIFTARQLVALTTVSDLVNDAMEHVRRDAVAAGLPDDGQSLRDAGTGASAYAEAVSVYLAFCVDRFADYWTSLGRWQTANQQLSNLFGRQAIPMGWDFPEANPFSGKGGSFENLLDWTVQSIPNIGRWGAGTSVQADASTQRISEAKVISTDPPYYDNICYADLSDFFYVWMRRSLRSVFPDLFATLTVPKAEELVATAYRHGGKEEAESFFLSGMTEAMRRLAEQAHPAFPVTIYYAFKQSEGESDAGVASTGWETFLDAVLRAGFSLSGTWPIRTEMKQRMINMDTNALASSIVLVCRKSAPDAPAATRREFIAALKAELPRALALLQRGNIAPVDLAQAAIGPGMAIYTSYAKVVDASGNALSVRDALTLINNALDEVLAAQEGDFDADTRFALAWFELQGFGVGEFGVAEMLSKAKATSVQGLVDAGIAQSGKGMVRLLRPRELDKGWDPAEDTRLTVWEMVHHLIRTLESGAETAAADLAKKLGSKAEVARELAYRLFVVCERKKWAAEALAYNGLVQSWPEITRLAHEDRKPAEEQGTLL